jgi:hypothetical protein
VDVSLLARAQRKRFRIANMHLPSTLLLALAACCASATACAETAVYKGNYFYNFENSAFTPEGSTERWCIPGNMEKAMLPSKSRSGQWGTADVEVRGELGPPGRYGGLGACSRVLTVTEVLVVRNKKSQK